MILQTIFIMDMLICWLEVNVENIKNTSNTHVYFFLAPSIYALKVCNVVLKLEVRSS